MSLKKCQIDGCGRDNSTHPNRVSYSERFGMVLCDKHKMQLNKNTKIFEQSRFESNTYEICGDYSKIYFNNFNSEVIGYFYIDTEDLEIVLKYKWFKRKDGRIVSNVTSDKTANATHIRVHNLVMNFNPINSNYVIDHIDRNPLNNRKENLRIVTNQVNCINRDIQINNKTGFCGVVKKYNGKYVAQIKFNRKMMRFGTYNNIRDAAKTRANVELYYFRNNSINYNIELDRIVLSNKEYEVMSDLTLTEIRNGDLPMEFKKYKYINYEENLSR